MRGEVRCAPRAPTLTAMRDLEVIDSELRLLAAVRRTARELTGRTPSSALIDDLLDERDQAARMCLTTTPAFSA
jgi:hypothetical protein